MKIALMQEFSQAAKNPVVLEQLNTVAAAQGHEVFNVGMDGDNDHRLTYIHLGICAALLLNAKAVDFVVAGCGTGQGAMLDRPAAGKTGTTSDCRDAWFVGYTPDLVAGVWIGCDDNEDLDGMTGGNLPATIWRLFMGKVVEGTPVKNFDGSRGIKGDTIDEITDENKKKDTDKNKKGPDNKTTQTDAGKRSEEHPGGDNKQPLPVQPAAPAPTAPGPGGGASKGKN